MNATQTILARANASAIRARTAIHFAASGKPLVRISYAEFTSLVNRAANALIALGAARGDRVLLLLADSPLYAASILAAMQIGAVAVPLNTKLAAADYAFIASDAKAKLLIADNVFASLVTEVRGCRVLYASVGNGFDESFTAAVSRASSHAPRVPATEANDPAFWLYSSGTTGRPKAVIHSHANAAHSSKLLREIVQAGEGTVVFATSKLFFAFALDNGLLGVLKAGATLVMNEAWAEPETVIQQAEEVRPAVFLTVPTLFRRLLMLPPERLQIFKSISWYFTGGERLPDVLANKWKEITGHDLLVCYGMSETFCNALSMRPDGVRVGSCGMPLGGVETRLLTREGDAVADGEPGVLWLRHPALALRYLHDEPTASAFKDGWFCTNDLFRVDADGFWFHEGRADDLLKVAGQWVKPNEVEEAALATATTAVREAACVVVTDSGGMDRLALYVVTGDGAQTDANIDQALRPALAAALPAHSLPKWIRSVDELPRTPTGKVQRFKLKARLIEELARSAA